MNNLVRHANRRAFLTACAGIGVTSNFFAGALSALASQNPALQIDDTMIDEAAWGLHNAGSEERHAGKAQSAAARNKDHSQA
jgi:hypothetical protein